jgi:hypothetical protein
MLRNVSESTKILEELGFKKVNSANRKETIMKHGTKLAEILPNGSVKIGDVVTDFKRVKKRKIIGI